MQDSKAFADMLARAQLDKLLGLAMLVLASTVFLYYTVWTLFMVGTPGSGLITY